MSPAQKEAWALTQVEVDPEAVAALSTQRIEAVRAALITAGLDASRVLVGPGDAADDDATSEASGTAGPAVRFEAVVP